MKILFVILINVIVASNLFSQSASGYVYYDRNENGIMEEGEEGLSGISVSNGIESSFFVAFNNFKSSI
ncbi:MAG: hypothetical protein KAI45_12815, partial [Melioribacteraceae bacterium]|nr:hypothetical protein [Melioribacteraceae bacterium]